MLKLIIKIHLQENTQKEFKAINLKVVSATFLLVCF